MDSFIAIFSQTSRVRHKGFFELLEYTCDGSKQGHFLCFVVFNSKSEALVSYKGKVRIFYGKDDQNQRHHYEGDIEKGLRHGRGTIVWTHGCTYDGEWKNDIMDGMGTMRWPSLGQTYRGQFFKNMMHGLGRMEWVLPSGVLAAYEGEWEDGKRHGKGTMVYDQNDEYNRTVYDGNNYNLTLFIGQCH